MTLFTDWPEPLAIHVYNRGTTTFCRSHGQRYFSGSVASINEHPTRFTLQTGAEKESEAKRESSYLIWATSGKPPENIPAALQSRYNLLHALRTTTFQFQY
ncbi:hypothetical protein [Hymenobacter koreensis]|uniref:hypothetical protein n=1 Tax=Hymenobacter koreensis TaxID=1084523 RepID=UPI0031E611E2